MSRKATSADLPPEQKDKLRRYEELERQIRGGSENATGTNGPKAPVPAPTPIAPPAGMLRNKLAVIRQKSQGSLHSSLGSAPAMAPVPDDGAPPAAIPPPPAPPPSRSAPVQQTTDAGPRQPAPLSTSTSFPSAAPAPRVDITAPKMGLAASLGPALGALGGGSRPALLGGGRGRAGGGSGRGSGFRGGWSSGSWASGAERDQLKSALNGDDGAADAASSSSCGAAAAAPANGPPAPAYECCEKIGCVCLEPGLRCKFAWRKNSGYEAQRDASKAENEAMLRSLGLLPPLPSEATAEPTGKAASNAKRRRDAADEEESDGNGDGDDDDDDDLGDDDDDDGYLDGFAGSAGDTKGCARG